MPGKPCATHVKWRSTGAQVVYRCRSQGEEDELVERRSLKYAAVCVPPVLLTLQARFWAEVYDGAKLFYLSGMQHGKYLKREVRVGGVEGVSGA